MGLESSESFRQKQGTFALMVLFCSRWYQRDQKCLQRDAIMFFPLKSNHLSYLLSFVVLKDPLRCWAPDHSSTLFRPTCLDDSLSHEHHYVQEPRIFFVRYHSAGTFLLKKNCLLRNKGMKPVRGCGFSHQIMCLMLIVCLAAACLPCRCWKEFPAPPFLR
jgi:hypothetical protein